MKKSMIIIVLILTTGLSLLAGDKSGKWEIGVHYSAWSINIIRPWLEDHIIPEFENYDPDKGQLNFDSNGNNYGLELRYFPKGKKGSFSIGLSYERNYFRAKLNGSYTDHDSANNRIDVVGDGELEILPHSLNLSFRWEIFPRSRLHPYFGIGVGIGPLDGSLDLQATKTTFYNGFPYTETFDERKTMQEVLDELEEEDNAFPLSFFPVVHVCFGLRGELMDNVFLLGEVAVYDGLIFRGGLAFRF